MFLVLLNYVVIRALWKIDLYLITLIKVFIISSSITCIIIIATRSYLTNGKKSQRKPNTSIIQSAVHMMHV